MQLTTEQLNEIAKTVAYNLSDLDSSVALELALELMKENAEDVQGQCDSVEEVIDFVQELVEEQYEANY